MNLIQLNLKKYNPIIFNKNKVVKMTSLIIIKITLLPIVYILPINKERNSANTSSYNKIIYTITILRKKRNSKSTSEQGICLMWWKKWNNFKKRNSLRYNLWRIKNIFFKILKIKISSSSSSSNNNYQIIFMMEIQEDAVDGQSDLLSIQKIN